VVELKGKKVFRLHFCTTFNGKSLDTQFYDDTRKRDRFVSIHPTPPLSSEHPASLRVTSNGQPADWDRTPVFMCLAPAVEVTETKVHRPAQPCKEIDVDDVSRLNMLIEEAKKLHAESDAEAESESSSFSSGESSLKNSSQNLSALSESHDRLGEDSAGGSNYETSFPALQPQSRFRNYASDVGVWNWQKEMHGILVEADNEDTCSEVFGEGQPDHTFQVKDDKFKFPNVEFYPLPNSLTSLQLDEEDPANAFKIEARERRAYKTIVLT